MSKCMECKNDNYWARECPAGTDDILVANGVVAECAKFVSKTCNTGEKPAETKEDPVNSPSHYTQGGIECIEAIKASMTAEQYRGYLKGNLLKYVWRYEQKGKPSEDLQKARWYLDRLLKEVSE